MKDLLEDISALTLLSKKYWHMAIGGQHKIKMLLRCVKHVIFVDDLHQCGEIVKDHFNSLWQLNHL
jgi:hypothetical protein